MNSKRMIVLSIVGALALVGLLLAATGAWASADRQSSAAPLAQAGVVSGTISYQGRLLNADGTPVEGMHMMAFRIYEQASGGMPLWSDSFAVPVEEGLFHVHLGVDPALFDGRALWLGVWVEGDTEEMSPRQPLLPAPYALHALSAPWAGLMDVPAGLDDGDDDTTYTAGTGLSLVGTQFRVSASYRLPQSCGSGQIAKWSGGSWQCGDDDMGPAGWSLTGNSGTDPTTDFLGTTDGVSLTLAVSGTSALRLEPNDVSPNLIGGHGGNSVAPGVVGAVIGGGGDSTYPNQVTGDYGAIGGGYGNTASHGYATIGGGEHNTASGFAAIVGGGEHNTAISTHGTVGGGHYNTASGGLYGSSTVGGGEHNTASGIYSTIGGGYSGTASAGAATVGGGYGNTASGTDATVGGGAGNSAGGGWATVGGGRSNTASGDGATIAGGEDNVASGDEAAIAGGYYNTASGTDATVGGGEGNSAGGGWATVGGGHYNTASGRDATVGGGYYNFANAWSATIGGGSYNTATGDGATVPGGDGNTASGGYSFAAGALAHATHVGSFVWSSADSALSWGDNTFTARAHGGVRFYSASGITTGVELSSGGSSWASVSDRNAKENFADVDAVQVLETLAAMPMRTWNLKSQSSQMRHIGPVAQDFNGEFAYLFGEVESPVHVNNMDAIGIALAAAQGLHELSQDQAGRIRTLETEASALHEENAGLRQQVEALQVENVVQQEQLDDVVARLAELEAAAGMGRASQPNAPGGWWILGGLVVVAFIVGQRRRSAESLGSTQRRPRRSVGGEE